MRFVYFDLAFLGQESVDAADAAHCAQDQDKFWEYHDLLFGNAKNENAGDFKRENLDKFAQQLGLNMTQFGQCMDSHKYRDFIQAEAQEARRNGVSSTPTIFVNRTPLQGFVPYENEKADRTITIAPGATITAADKLKVGANVCLSGEADNNRRLTKGEVSDPPGDDQKLCGDVKKYAAATADNPGELIITETVAGLKQIIEEELKNKK